MSGQSFRFLHASDFHLEEPLGGLAEVPPHLGELFLDAPFTAAERVLDVAVRERVDCLFRRICGIHPAWLRRRNAARRAPRRV